MILPDWIEKILIGMGVAGAVIFILMVVIVFLVGKIVSMQKQADKIYGFRLQERDRYNETVTGATTVLRDMLKSQEERNELIEEQAKLIERQSQGFEILKITVLAQYDTIRDHNGVMAATIGSMAEAIRTLTMMVAENRQIAAGHVNDVNRAINDLSQNLRGAMTTSTQAHLVELRSLLSSGTVVQRRRKSPP
jgi:ABC-type multidrug transport system fused ATPase/permease subunit